MRDPPPSSPSDEAVDAVSWKDIATVTGTEPEVGELPGGLNTCTFTGIDIGPDPEAGNPFFC